MGAEQSSEETDTPYLRVLSSSSIEGIAEYILQGKAKTIMMISGAGISTSAGIPDFRSPDSGLYSNLERLDLPYPEAVFDISYFRQNPEPFYILAKELYPGKFYPTVSHCFIALLQEKELLGMAYSQNVDTLERIAGVRADKIVEAHGSFATQRCIDCKTPHPDDLMMQAIESGEVPICQVSTCHGMVKPDIVFFGESLPSEFSEKRMLMPSADLVIIMGTSLSVHPFAGLPQFALKNVPRLLINLECVGGLGSRLNDVVYLGRCDDGVRELADALGWREELEERWLRVNGGSEKKDVTTSQQPLNDATLTAEIEKITLDIENQLKLSNDHVANNTIERGLPAAQKSSSTSVWNRDPADMSVRNAFAGFFEGEALDPTMPQNKPNSLST